MSSLLAFSTITWPARLNVLNAIPVITAKLATCPTSVDTPFWVCAFLLLPFRVRTVGSSMIIGSGKRGSVRGAVLVLVTGAGSMKGSITGSALILSSSLLGGTLDPSLGQG